MKDDPVFPTPGYSEFIESNGALRGLLVPDNPGLTKREHFAAMAMQALLSNSNFKRLDLTTIEHAVEAADALIAQLKKTNENEGGK